MALPIAVKTPSHTEAHFKTNRDRPLHARSSVEIRVSKCATLSLIRENLKFLIMKL